MSREPASEEAIFEIARRIDSPVLRADYIDQACAGDSNLKHRVAGLLEIHMQEASFLESTEIRRTVAQHVTEKAGDQIGAFKLLQKIGEGGFGVVYMAEQTMPVRRRVALKVIKPGMDTKEVIARFEVERQALAIMEHPNIAKVLDGGETESGRPYFVMELVKGVPLTKFCDANKLDVRRRLNLFKEVCNAIQHAHQKGVIHRDIKPSNVLVTLHDGEPVPKVIDFGVAKAISQQLTTKTLYTAFGQMIGTPQYMSPEQAEMSGLDIDTRSDIYSLGVLLYELLTGTTPIEPARLRETAYAEIQRMIREEEPARPSQRVSTLGDALIAVAANRRAIPERLGLAFRGELDWIVMKSLDKDRRRRYETANALAADVTHYLNDEPVSACPPSTLYRVGKFTRRNKTLVSASAATLLTLLLVTAGTYFAYLRVRDAKIQVSESAALAQAALAETKQAREDALEDWYIADINHAGLEASAGNFELTIELLRHHVPEDGQKDSRGLEWYLMWKRIQAGLLAETVPIPIDVTSLAISPDQKLAAVGGWTSDIYLVDIEARTAPILAIPGGTAPVQFLPNGRFLASAVVAESSRSTWRIELWDTAEIPSGKHASRVASLAVDHRPQKIVVSPDGHLIASCSRLSTEIEVWKRTGPEPQAVTYTKLPSITLPRSASQGIEDISFALGGNALAYSSRGQGLGILKLPAPDWDSPILFDKDELVVSGFTPTFAVTPDGTKLAYSRQRQIVVRDLAAERSLHTVDADDNVQGLSWSSDGELLISSQDDNSTLVWNFRDRTRHRVWGHSRKVRQAAIIKTVGSPCLITANQERQLRYCTLDEAHGFALDGVMDCIFVASARNRSDTVLAFKDCSIALWELGSADTPRTLYRHRDEVRHVAYSPKGAISSISAAELRLWKPATQESVVLDENPWGNSVVFSQDGNTLASFHSNRIKVWDVTEGSLLRVLRHDGVEYIDGGVFLAGKTQILSDSGVGNNQLCLWDYGLPASQPKLVRKFSMNDAMWGATGFAVAPRTDQIAVAGISGIKILDPASLESIHAWKGHGDHVDSVTYASHSNTLASSGRDGLLRLWDATTFQPKLCLTAPRGHEIEGLCLVGDDSAICLVDNGQLRVWQIARMADVRAAGW